MLLVLTRRELIAQERAYFLSTKPMGIMLYISMLIAYLVGSVILIQVLSTDISNRMGEYATMKAMGFPAMPCLWRGRGAGGAAVAGRSGSRVAVGALVLAFIQYRTHLATFPGLGLACGTMMAIALVLAAGAAAIALRRVARADPAELF